MTWKIRQLIFPAVKLDLVISSLTMTQKITQKMATLNLSLIHVIFMLEKHLLMLQH